MKNIKTAVCIAVLMMLMSVLCVSAFADTQNEVTVTDIDELIASIAPNTTINLEAGNYDLFSAKTYGGDTENRYCRWVETYDGYELLIIDVSGLSVIGTDSNAVTLSALPRYANVLNFEKCRDITLVNFTAGHTKQQGTCAGGVLKFEKTDNISIDGCSLFGCGILGVEASDCADISIINTEIFDCSYGAMNCYTCKKILLESCEIYRCGIKGAEAYDLFYLQSCSDFSLNKCSVHDNYAQRLFSGGYSGKVSFTSDRIEKNVFSDAVFSCGNYSPIVEGCSFISNTVPAWYDAGGVFATDSNGNVLTKTELESMGYDSEVVIKDNKNDKEQQPSADVLGVVRVKTVDEFLAAIASNTTIILNSGTYDLSTASQYGNYGGEHYRWEEEYDGPELVITDVSNLTIIGDSGDPENYTITASPRYADVISFNNCSGITVDGITAGHTEAPGTCSGGVLNFVDCNGIYLYACRLFGCGISGIEANRCIGLTAENCEIYDCSFYGVNISFTSGIEFINCDIHDINGPALVFYESTDKIWNGNPISTAEQFMLSSTGELRDYY